MKTRGNVLVEALTVINGERQGTYGNPENSFADIATLWNWYLDSRGNAKPADKSTDRPADKSTDKPAGKLTGGDVAMMMLLLKVAREVGGQHKHDNIVDLAGYAGLYEDLINVAD